MSGSSVAVPWMNLLNLCTCTGSGYGGSGDVPGLEHIPSVHNIQAQRNPGQQWYCANNHLLKDLHRQEAPHSGTFCLCNSICSFVLQLQLLCMCLLHNRLVLAVALARICTDKGRLTVAHVVCATASAALYGSCHSFAYTDHTTGWCYW